jgi:hypothetical protein
LNNTKPNCRGITKATDKNYDKIGKDTKIKYEEYTENIKKLEW